MPNRSLPASLAEEMPAPSTELTLIGVMMRAHLKCLPPKKRRLFLLEVMETLSDFEDLRKVVRLRGREHDEMLALTHRQAVAWTRGMTSAFLVSDVMSPRE